MTDKVLIVDDDPALRWLLCKRLEKLHVHFDCASNGNEALERLNKFPYKMVLMDINMPGMDGYDTTRAIRAKEKESIDPLVPVIAITADPDPQLCLDAGVTECLPKPVDPET